MKLMARHPLTRFGLRLLPFADAASADLPMRQLLRLSLFQVSVGMATVMLLVTTFDPAVLLVLPAWVVLVAVLLLVRPAPEGRS